MVFHLISSSSKYFTLAPHPELKVRPERPSYQKIVYLLTDLTDTEHGTFS